MKHILATALISLLFTAACGDGGTTESTPDPATPDVPSPVDVNGDLPAAPADVPEDTGPGPDLPPADFGIDHYRHRVQMSDEDLVLSGFRPPDPRRRSPHEAAAAVALRTRPGARRQYLAARAKAAEDEVGFPRSTNVGAGSGSQKRQRVE